MKKKILIVDDVEAIRLALKVSLAKEYDIVESSSVDVAISFLEKDKDIALVITDMMMPDKDGADLLYHIEDNFPDLKTIAISGGGGTVSSKTILDAARRMANKTVSKPFRMKEIQDAVAEVLA